MNASYVPFWAGKCVGPISLRATRAGRTHTHTSQKSRGGLHPRDPYKQETGVVLKSKTSQKKTFMQERKKTCWSFQEPEA